MKLIRTQRPEGRRERAASAEAEAGLLRASRRRRRVLRPELQHDVARRLSLGPRAVVCPCRVAGC